MTLINAVASSTFNVDEGSFIVIVSAAAVAALAVTFLGPRVAIPVVVLELLFGIVIGPQVLDIATPDAFIQFFANLGLGMLFFFAGYEIDFQRIRGKALNLAIGGWVLSLVLAYGIGGVLAWAGVVVSLLYTGSAMATTAIGTLVPIITDAGEMRTRFGTYLLGAGAIGEFGPILLLTLVLTTTTAKNTEVLIAFVVLAVLAAVAAVRLVPRMWPTGVRDDLRARFLCLRARLGAAARRVRCRHDRAPRRPRARSSGARIEAGRDRLRLPNPLLLHLQRHEL
jgi:Kef-type K+ transport system membrane component KefB